MKKAKRYKGLLMVLLLLGAALLAMGCKSRKAETEESAESGYELYYINKSETAVVTVPYEPQSTGTDALIKELLKQLRQTPEDTDLEAVLTKKADVQSYSLENGQLTLDMKAGYQELSQLKEILCRSALVRTLCQIPDVEYVAILINGSPLLDSKKTPIGFLNADSFVENMGEAINTTTVTSLTLYFANEAGDHLVSERVNVTDSSNISAEKLVVERLIKGPITDGAYPTLPEGTKLLSISTKDGICYVNLNEGFQNQGYNVTEAVTIYSIVDSLTELPGVNKVQILINGETNLVYRESFRLDTIYERNLDIIEQ